MIQPHATSPVFARATEGALRPRPKARRVQIGPSVVLILLGLAGCQKPGQQAGPENVASKAKERRSFVPPFAYEAYIRGELALASGQPDAAALQLEMATAAPDEDAYLLSRLAEAQSASGEQALAEQTLAEAERIGPCTENVWLTRGAWAERAKQLEQAEHAYRSALSCQPGSQASALGLYRVLKALGRTAESLSLLEGEGALTGETAADAAARRVGERARGTGLSAARVAVSQALAEGSSAEARFALESWSALGPVDSAMLEEAAAQAIARKDALLALRLTELAWERLPAEAQGRLALLLGDRAALRALLSQHHEQALGGSALAARIALEARDFERAELYANLDGKADEALRALKVQALQGLHQEEAALVELRGLEDGATRRALSRTGLMSLALGALGLELAKAAP